MQNSVRADYLIVGQGLAGSALAVRLMLRKKKIVVIDRFAENISSRVAAGLFNPITGRQFAKTWLADALFPSLHEFYRAAEQLTGKRFFFPLPMYRPFVSVEEQNEWMGRSEAPSYRSFFEQIFTSSQYSEVHDPLGGMLLRQCGYLDTNAYMTAVRALVRAEGEFRDEYFDADALEVSGGHVRYQDVVADRVIFCQGTHGSSNKWFREAQVRPLKGETLTIKTGWEKDVILNRGVYMVRGSVPGEFRVGSTYNFSNHAPGVTAEGRAEIEEKLRSLIRMPYTVMQQEWGLRPTTPNRRPVLGYHPASERLVIFNGLGTKGVSLAPYFSEILFHSLENGLPLDKDVNVTRFKLLY